MLENGMEVSPAMEAVLTMWPSPWAMNSGVNARIPWITPQRLTPSTHCQSSSVCSHTGPPAETPALLQITWAVPKRSTARSRSASTWAASATSHTTASTSEPSGRSATAAASTSASMSATTTFMPSARNARVMASPMPEAPPVTTATLPFSSSMPAPLSVRPDVGEKLARP